MTDFSIGGRVWPGLGKLIEEAGEVQQVCGKLIGSRGETKHFDGTDLRKRLEEELADLLAAITFFARANDLDEDSLAIRANAKYAQFLVWHAKESRASVQ